MDIMIDIETFAIGADAVIVQIGAVAFDPTGTGIADEGICLNLDPQAGINAGMRIDWSTLHWWMGEPKARETLAAPGTGMLLSAALEHLSAYVKRYPGCYVWAHGPHFDIANLEYAFRRCRIEIPWKYSRICDTRTLSRYFPAPRRNPQVAHNALSDAVAQALWVQDMVRGIGAPPREEETGEPQAAAPSTVSEKVPADKSDLLLFYEKLERTDWTYMMSDDGSVERRGHEAMSRILAEAKTDPAKQALYDAFYKFKWGKGLKPDKPS